MPETHSAAQAPRWMWPFINGPTGAFTQFGQAQRDLPTIAQLAQSVPGLDIPGLTPEQLTALGQLTGTATENPDLARARAQLESLTSGPVGSSPATQAGMQAFEELTLPSILQTQSLQGTAGGGAALEAASQGATAAAVPLIQQEIQDRSNAVQGFAGLGAQDVQNLAMSLEAQGLPREVALEQAQAQHEQQQQQWQTRLGLQSYPLSLFDRFIGQRNWGTMTSEDYVSGIGKGLSPSGLFGGGG